jgi:hypothetical protein
VLLAAGTVVPKNDRTSALQRLKGIFVREIQRSRGPLHLEAVYKTKQYCQQDRRLEKREREFK